ncbi:MAG: TrbG/VirB9 family P-type conjugative transfer protein [Gemmatimonadota bacterium]|nr:TrbG/VirB9 family P-type conjugative transfer protein [Gemmatimonadota bacterium]
MRHILMKGAIAHWIVVATTSVWGATVSLEAQPTRPDTPPAVVIPDSGDAITAATKEYQARRVARTVIEGNFVTFPFGHSQPTLTCSVLRACVIELQPGEIVLSRIAGDTERWEIHVAAAGSDGKTVLIVVKPRDCDITTNVVLATDRRLYDLTLDSPPCKARSTNPQQPYARHVRFYYPDETVASWTKPAPPEAVRIAPDVLTLNFNYEVEKDRKFPWAPAQVFDDGARVYIKLPEEAKHAEVPVLFVLDAQGGKTLVNYALVGGDTYVTDRLFERAVLVAGVDGKERKVRIERKGGAGR